MEERVSDRLGFDSASSQCDERRPQHVLLRHWVAFKPPVLLETAEVPGRDGRVEPCADRDVRQAQLRVLQEELDDRHQPIAEA